MKCTDLESLIGSLTLCGSTFCRFSSASCLRHRRRVLQTAFSCFFGFFFLQCCYDYREAYIIDPPPLSSPGPRCNMSPGDIIYYITFVRVCALWDFKEIYTSVVFLAHKYPLTHVASWEIGLMTLGGGGVTCPWRIDSHKDLHTHTCTHAHCVLPVVSSSGHI